MLKQRESQQKRSIPAPPPSKTLIFHTTVPCTIPRILFPNSSLARSTCIPTCERREEMEKKEKRGGGGKKGTARVDWEEMTHFKPSSINQRNF